jgi:hypothetical protein
MKVMRAVQEAFRRSRPAGRFGPAANVVTNRLRRHCESQMRPASENIHAAISGRTVMITKDWREVAVQPFQAVVVLLQRRNAV